jgi:hypothetical protein
MEEMYEKMYKRNVWEKCMREMYERNGGKCMGETYGRNIGKIYTNIMYDLAPHGNNPMPIK